MSGLTIIDKIWNAHRVKSAGDDAQLIYIDRIFLHERTGSIALLGLQSAGRRVRNPGMAYATMDHIVDTLPGRSDETTMPGGEAFIKATRRTAREAGITLFDIGDSGQGIVHVISPEHGIALPGVTLVCPDSHTCTVGGLGALAWGIGSSDAEHALATQTLEVRKPRQMRVSFSGRPADPVSAKDLILHLIGRYGAAGGVGYAVEFAGSAVAGLEVEGRLTLCNMAVEFGAWTGLVAPDARTIEYVAGRQFAPRGRDWELAVQHWSLLPTDDDAEFDRDIDIDVRALGPQVTWGTSPQHVGSIDAPVPAVDPKLDSQSRASVERAMQYMDLRPGTRLRELPLDAAFIGSCTNSRLSDLREAATILEGRKVAPGIRALCVPGSTSVKRRAEREGLDRIFVDAGFEWRESGCSLCFYAGGEGFSAGQRIISTTNRNFEGRQGIGARTHLASPATVAASAVLGRIGHRGEL